MHILVLMEKHSNSKIIIQQMCRCPYSLSQTPGEVAAIAVVRILSFCLFELLPLMLIFIELMVLHQQVSDQKMYERGNSNKRKCYTLNNLSWMCHTYI